MSDALYERYKEALRRGHVATLRGRQEAALAAYVEAATIAPERALPHSSIGAVYLRMGRPADALNAYGLALERAPSDEPALAGRADSLVALGRASEAAVTLDRLSNVQEADGRPLDALDSARRALELAESRSRRRAVSRLVERLRETAGDAPGEAALARALHLLEATAVALPEPPPLTHPAGAEGAGEAGPDGSFAESAPPPEPEPDPLTLMAEAEVAIDGGDASAGRDGLLRAADLFSRSGRSNAAMDACYEALSVAPDDPDLHLALAGLYLDRGWRTAAADKLALLARLADLTGDAATVERVRAIVGERLADEPRAREAQG